MFKFQNIFLKISSNPYYFYLTFNGITELDGEFRLFSKLHVVVNLLSVKNFLSSIQDENTLATLDYATWHFERNLNMYANIQSVYKGYIC